ncbi:FecR family protein [Undibacter mobilis]|uniref:FecR family protein n=1 Tax=Undibacter mobilis TaxID=2292256 RepID=UPI001FE11CBA|nr:FecR domain-containing protein [Undibacter mobilis]
MKRDDVNDKNGGRGLAHGDAVADEALDWVIRLRQPDADGATRVAFEAWLARSPSHGAEFRNIEAMWASPSFEKSARSLSPGQSVATPPVAVRRSRGVSRQMALAASIAILAIGVWQFPRLQLWLNADYVTAAGVQSTVTLPDGSTMMLNSGSAVAIDFAAGRRNVHLLKGEAFFDVRHDPQHPFRVAAHFGDVEVKGTAFAVKTLDKLDQVVLERGVVDVRRSASAHDKSTLAPRQMATATAASIMVSPVDLAHALAWRDGRIVFDNEPFANVVDELRRYYPGSLIVIGDSVKNLAVSGNYRIDDIEGAMRTLADAAGITMLRLPGSVVILR